MFRKEEQRLPVVVIDSNSNHWKESHFLCFEVQFSVLPLFPVYLARYCTKFDFFGINRKSRRRRLDSSCQKMSVSEKLRSKIRKRYWPLFFRGAKWPKPGRSLARPLSREGGGQIWWLGHGCEGETMLDTPIWFLGGFLGLLFRLVPFSFPRAVRRPSFSRNLPHFF